jgi:hypothetical protein
VDGGVTACVFLQPAMMGIGPNGEIPSDAHPASIHVLIAGKLHQTAAPTKRELFAISGDSMNAVLQAKMEGELTRLFLLARYAKADFKLAGIRQDYKMPGTSMSFDPLVMRDVFEEGCRGGKDGTAWQSSPPVLEDLFSLPRSDTRFATVRGAIASNAWTPSEIRVTLDDNHSAPAQNNAIPAANDPQLQRLPPAPR